MRKNVKGIAVGMLTMSMLVSAPTMAFAGQTNGIGDTSVTAITQLAPKKDANKPGNQKPGTTKPKVESQKVGKVTCTSAGKVNISFKGKVTYTNELKAVIKDAEGREIPCKISKKNKSLLTVTVAGLVKDQTYAITIEGILGKDSTEAATITKNFVAKGMKTQTKVGKATVENKKFVVLKMQAATYYKDATVVVKDADGNTCDAKIVKKAKGNIKIQIAGMKKGKSYTVTVNGVRTQKEKNYGSITRTVTVK